MVLNNLYFSYCVVKKGIDPQFQNKKVGMSSQLEQLQQLVDKCSNVASNNERCKIFQQYAGSIKDLIVQIYDPFQKFHVTSANIVKFEKNTKTKGAIVNTTNAMEEIPDLSHLLCALSEGKVSGHAALQTCLNFIKEHQKYRDVILRALDKDLKIRVGVQMVNKAFPFLVPLFSCALSHPMEKHLKFYEKNKSEWMISRKLDGCRCIFVCENGKAVAYSRSGHIYPAHISGLDYFLKKFQNIHGVLDGEMGVVDDTGKEYFNIANSIMNPNAVEKKTSKNSKNLQIQPHQFLCYFAFDFIPLATFKKGEGSPVWKDRQVMLSNTIQLVHKDDVTASKQIRILTQDPSSKMDELWTEVEQKGYEGLMLRLRESNYEGKKTRNMLKRKIQDDEEFVIEEATTSKQMSPDSTDPVVALEHVGITYKGNRVWIGSGLTFVEKITFGQDPKQLVGRTVTVKHYGESKDKQGQYSLRHPSIKVLWEKTRTH